MEKQFKREDELMKRLLNDAGTESPSADFKNRIMMAIESRNAVITYKPLIPKFIWYIIAASLVLAVASLYMMYAEVSLSWSFDFRIPQFIELPSIRLSQTMQYAIAFVALFFLQIPFLKRMVDRQYQL